MIPVWLTPKVAGAIALVVVCASLGIYIKSLQWRLDRAHEMQAAAESTLKAAMDANARAQSALEAQAQAVSDVVAAGERREKSAAQALAAARTASASHEAKARALEAMTGTGCAAVVSAVEEAWIR